MGRSEVDTSESLIGNGTDQICKEDGGFFACYLLTSLNPRQKGNTYIGFTVDPRRRLRQHNGEIPSGAWKTKSNRPWEMVLCVFGFPTNVVALQFEWAWQHPTESLAVRRVAASFKSFSGVSNKIKLAYTMLTLPSWEGLNLTVNFFSTKYTKHCAGCPKLPEHMKFHVCPVDDLPCYIGSQNYLPCYIGSQNYWGSADDDYGDCEELQSPNTAENALGERSGETAEGSIALRDFEGCGGSGSPEREVSSFCFNVTVEDGEEEILTSEPDRFELDCWSRTGLQKTLDRLNECDEIEVVAAPAWKTVRDFEGCGGSSSPEREVSSFCFNATVEDGEEEILTVEPNRFELGCWSRTGLQKTLDKLNECDEVEVVDLLTPCPNSRIHSCNAKKRKVSMTHPQIIDLTRSPIFVEL